MLKKILAGLIVAALLVVPFLTSALNEQSPFEFIKLFVLCNVTLLVMAGVVFQLLKSPKMVLHWNRGLTLAGLILAANMLSFAFSNNHMNSFWADINVPTDSLLTMIVFFIFSFCCAQLFDSERSLKLLLSSLITAATALAVYGIVQHFGLDPVDWWGYSQMATNAYGTIGQAVGFGMIVGSAIPIALMMFLKTTNKSVKAVLLLVISILSLGVLYSGSRTPSVGAVLVIVGALAVYVFQNRTRQALKKVAAVLIAVSAAQALYFFESRTTGLGEKLTGQAIERGFGERTYIWQDALIIWKKYPILGAGPETFGTEQKIVNRREHNQFHNWELYWTKAHNHYIHHLATTGVVGLAAELMMLFFLLFSFFRLLKNDTKTDFESIGLFFAFVFLVINYLTAFNFVLTQLYSFLFPVLYFMHRTRQREFELKISKILKFSAAGSVLFFGAVLGISVFKYWKADVLFGTAKREFLLHKNTPKALAAIDEAIQIFEKNPRLYCRKATIVAAIASSGRSRYSQDELKSMVEMVDTLSQQCVNLDERNAENIAIRAKLMAELFINRLIDSPRASIEGFREAAEVNPNNPTYYYRLGSMFLNSNSPEEYIKNMRYAIELKEDYLPAYTDLMGFYYRRGDRAAVDELVQKVAKISFERAEFTAEIGNMINLAELNKDIPSRQILINTYLSLKASGLIR